MTYDLRRLRLHGLIRRAPGTHRYHVTDRGLRIALFFTRSYVRLLRPGLSVLLAENIPANSTLRVAFQQVETETARWVTAAKLAA